MTSQQEREWIAYQAFKKFEGTSVQLQCTDSECYRAAHIAGQAVADERLKSAQDAALIAIKNALDKGVLVSELEQRLKIATEALELINDTMPNCSCMDTKAIASKALKQIRGGG